MNLDATYISNVQTIIKATFLQYWSDTLTNTKINIFQEYLAKT